jgi:hypothetical protein
MGRILQHNLHLLAAHSIGRGLSCQPQNRPQAPTATEVTMATATSYCVKLDENDQPYLLFRFNRDLAREEIWKGPGPGDDDWEPGEFLEDVLDGSFAYEMTDEKNARKAFPAAFT